MLVATKMIVICKHCGLRQEISAKDLIQTHKNVEGCRKFYSYNCKKCNEKNHICSREISVHILRELGEF